MAKELTRIPLAEFSRNLNDLFARVVQEHQAVVVEGENGELAVLKPLRPSRRRPQGCKKTTADYEAFLSSAGSWKGLVDTDQLIADIYESRRIPSRPPIEL